MPEPDTDVAWLEAQTIAFGDRLAASEAFLGLFREGMSLIEETAAYLDGPGRKDSRELNRTIALAYATESMRLTTRLMQVASWLLLQRAVNEGELTKDQARLDKGKMKIGGLSTSDAIRSGTELPEPLRLLIERSLRLQERVVHLDRLIYEAEAPGGDNPVERDLARLKAAFGSER